MVDIVHADQSTSVSLFHHERINPLWLARAQYELQAYSSITLAIEGWRTRTRTS